MRGEHVHTPRFNAGKSATMFRQHIAD